MDLFEPELVLGMTASAVLIIAGTAVVVFLGILLGFYCMEWRDARRFARQLKEWQERGDY